jgi:hypothetical protein
VWLQRHRDEAGFLEPALDPVALEVGAHPSEVLLAEALEHLDLVGEARDAVLDAMGKGGVEEVAVAAARPAADRPCLEQDDVAPGVIGLGVKGRPRGR